MMKEILVFGDLPIASKVCEEILKYSDVVLSGVVLGAKSKIKNNDPWKIPPLKEYAKMKNIPILNFEAIIKTERKYFLGISARFSRIIPISIITSFRNGIINFHGGLLPEYGGLYSTCHSILEDSKYGGGTIHYIDEGIDTGEIIKRCEVEISANETSFSLFEKTQLALFENFQQVFPSLLKGEKPKNPYPKNIGRNYFDKNSLVGKKEIEFNLINMEEIYRKVRAFDFPGHEPAYINFNGEKIFLTTQDFFKKQ